MSSRTRSSAASSPSAAAGERRRLEEMLGYSRLALRRRRPAEGADRGAGAVGGSSATKSLEAYANTLGRINQPVGRDRQAAERPDIQRKQPAGARREGAGGPVLTNAKDMLEFIKRGGFDVVMHPLDPEARQRSIDAVQRAASTNAHEPHDAGRARRRARARERKGRGGKRRPGSNAAKQMEDRMEHLRKVHAAPPVMLRDRHAGARPSRISSAAGGGNTSGTTGQSRTSRIGAASSTIAPST